MPLDRLNYLKVTLVWEGHIAELNHAGADLTKLDMRTVPDGRSDLLRNSVSIVSNMVNLQYLNLAGNIGAAEESLAFLATLTDLKYLSLSGTYCWKAWWCESIVLPRFHLHVSTWCLLDAHYRLFKNICQGGVRTLSSGESGHLAVGL